MSTQEISLGKIEDLAMARVDFQEGRTLRISFETEGSGSDPEKIGSADASVGFKRLWHDDLNNLLPKLNMHLARMGGMFGYLTDEPIDKWPNAAINWWDETSVLVKTNSITWAGNTKTKIKLAGSIKLAGGSMNLQPNIIDLKRPKYSFIEEFEELLDQIKDEVVAYLVDKKCAGGTQLEMEFGPSDDQDDEEIQRAPLLELPASSLPTSPQVFRNGIETALKQQPGSPKISKGALGIVSEHLRQLCINNGCFAPGKPFNADHFFNEAARAILDASTEVKTSDPDFKTLVEINVSTDPEHRIKWRELKNTMVATSAGYFNNDLVCSIASNFMKLMVAEEIFPMQQWHSPQLYVEKAVEIAEKNSTMSFPDIINNTNAAFQHLIHTK